jgi:hypothetical protein
MRKRSIKYPVNLLLEKTHNFQLLKVEKGKLKIPLSACSINEFS